MSIIFKFTTRAIRCHSSLAYLQEATCGSFNNIATEDSLRYAMELVDLFLVDKATVILLLPRCGQDGGRGMLQGPCSKYFFNQNEQQRYFVSIINFKKFICKSKKFLTSFWKEKN